MDLRWTRWQPLGGGAFARHLLRDGVATLGHVDGPDTGYSRYSVWDGTNLLYGGLTYDQSVRVAQILAECGESRNGRWVYNVTAMELCMRAMLPDYRGLTLPVSELDDLLRAGGIGRLRLDSAHRTPGRPRLPGRAKY